MTSAAENEILTRVSKGTPMGDFMREYWIPVLIAADVESDGMPVRIRVLGEDLIVFRDTEGKVGVLSPYCAHRGASLYFGRNEDCGLRCVYHGWKFDVDGKCLDTPNANAELLKNRVRQPSYPVIEKNRIIWTYMGSSEPPALPELEINLVPEDHVYVSLRVQECNWLQALEGSIDSSHGNFLHSRVDGYTKGNFMDLEDTSPTFDVVDADYGVSIGARRDASDGMFHWRVNQFLFPFYTLVPPFKKDPFLNGQAWVPVDDENCLMFHFTWHPTEPLPDSLISLHRDGRRDGSETGHLSINGRLKDDEVDKSLPYYQYRGRYNQRNDYGMDVHRQRSKYYSGVMPIWPQDAAMQESMRPISDRSKEILCASDIGIVRTRRALLHAANRFRDEGATPPGVADPDVYRIRPIGLLSKDDEVAPVLADHVAAEGPLGYEPF